MVARNFVWIISLRPNVQSSFSTLRSSSRLCERIFFILSCIICRSGASNLAAPFLTAQLTALVRSRSCEESICILSKQFIIFCDCNISSQYHLTPNITWVPNTKRSGRIPFPSIIFGTISGRSDSYLAINHHVQHYGCDWFDSFVTQLTTA